VPPSRYGKYEVLRKIASGGMAEVYLCRLTGEEGFRKRVALKVVHPRHADDPRFRDLFAREARLAATLSHPNLVQVFDFGREGGGYFLAMEFVGGRNLAQVAARARQIPLPVPSGVWRHWVEGIWSGLAYLHEKGIVHRDVSPSNVLVGRSGVVKVTDFGISRFAGEEGAPEGAHGGKSGYLSPERARGEEATFTSDRFAAAVIAAELLLDGRLFEGARTEEVLEKILSFDGLLLPFPGVDPPVANLLRKALAASPAERYPAAGDFLLELARVAPARAASPAVAEYWDALFPEGAEEETVSALGDVVEGRPAMVREKKTGYGLRGKGVQAGAAAAFVALAVGGALVWKMVGNERPAPPKTPVATPVGEPGVSPTVGIGTGSPPSPSPSPSAEPSRPARRVIIETEPPGASVSLENGPEIGVTPLFVDASTLEGRKFVLAREGYGRKTVPGSALGNRSAFRIELEPLLGTVEAIQAIPWAKVYLGERYLGETPLTSVRLPVGRHRLRFVNEPLGAERFERVDVRPGLNPKVIVPMAGTGRK